MNAPPLPPPSGGPLADEMREYLKRAADELDMAQRSEDPGAVAQHYQLAESYLDLVYGIPDDAS